MPRRRRRQLRRIILAWLGLDVILAAAVARTGGDPLANAHPGIRRGAGCPLPFDHLDP